MKKNIIIGAIALGIIAIAVAVASAYVSYLEVLEIGNNFTVVFWKNLSVRLMMQSGFFLLIFILAIVTNLILRRNLNVWDEDTHFLGKGWRLFWISALLSVVGSTLIGESLYSTVLPGLYPAWFRMTDPILGHNIGYYVFQRPMFIALVNSLLAIAVFFMVYSLVLYALYFVRNGLPKFSYILSDQKGIIVHLVVNIALCFTILAVKLHFLAEDILFLEKASTTGGGYTDVMVWLNFYKIAPFLLLTIVGICVLLLFKAKLVQILYALASFPMIWLLVVVIAAFVQNIVVKPNEEASERYYIRHSIDYTRMAYNIANISESEYPIYNSLSAANLPNNSGITDILKITDSTATLNAFTQLQSMRSYYSFKDADLVPFMQGGKKYAGLISCRELNVQESARVQGQSYINERMKYTHGYGVVMSLVNQTTPEGQPKLLVKNIPLEQAEGMTAITQPRIYFGEAASGYALVNTTLKEMDYAQGQQEFENSYDGNAGIPLSGFKRILFAAKYADMNMLTTSYITKDSKILINRNIQERVRKAAPFISFDTNPYMVIAEDGSLKWMVDGYTTTKYFPYAQAHQDMNYIRNSVKAVVDAYNGSVELYIIDYNDPIISCYHNAYPGLFNTGALPYDIAAQNKYPEYLFKIQAEILKKYHVTNPSKFYAKSDIWEIAREKTGIKSEIKNMEPNFSRVNAFGREQLMLMLPYTLAGDDNNLVAMIAVSSEGEDYGSMVSYEFPRGVRVSGTLQIENKIDNDPNISKEINALKQGGSRIQRGNMLAIPIENSILFIEPIYTVAANNTALSELKKIVIVYGETIVMETNLQDAFQKLFDTYQPSLPEEIVPPEKPTITLPEDVSELISRAVLKYSELKQFLAENDWVNYGKVMKEFDGIMQEFSGASFSSPSPQPTKSPESSPKTKPTPTPSVKPTPVAR